ncbi:MAG: glycosyltransferase [Burkholderiaceae bacterium]|nr:glycosyltransferase [Burkholderiaceae bacterium]
MKQPQDKNALVKKTLCLCMIVKNESHIILETLHSIKDYLDYWVICDTGSTDNTVALVQDFFALHGIPGEIHSEKWVNFGHNRTQAFDYAHQTADYLWVMDADDVLVGKPDFSNLEADSYSLRYGTEFVYWRPQLFKGSERWAYQGVLHEYAICTSRNETRKGFVSGQYHIDSRRLGARNRVDPVVKYLGDAHVLELALQHESDPDLTKRYLFYLAQSYRDAGQNEQAIAWYQKRVAAGGWAEEVWFSTYQAGLLYELLGDVENAKKHYLEAYEYRPTRAEALYSLGKMCNLRKDFFQAHMFLDAASRIPFTQDLLFVFKDVYDYLIPFELSISAYWVGDFEGSVALSRQVIALKDKVPLNIFEQAQKNRDFGVEKLSSAGLGTPGAGP